MKEEIKEKIMIVIGMTIVLGIGLIVHWFASGWYVIHVNNMDWTREQIFWLLGGQAIMYGSLYTIYLLIKKPVGVV